TTTASTTVDTTALANGAHAFELRAMDSANNWGTAGRTISVDNAAPTVALSRGATDYGRTVRWSVADAHSGVDGASLAGSYSTDSGATWQPMSGASWSGGTFSAELPAGTPDGRVRVRVSGRDNAIPGGNGFTSDAATVGVDRTPPVAKLDGAGNPDVAHAGAITVTLSATDALSGMGAAPADEPAISGGHVAYRLDGGGWVRARGDEAQIAVAGDGTHTLAYYAVDAAGNRSDERSRTIRIAAAAATAAPGPQAGFWHRTRNPLSTFTAAKRFGPPCPAAATLTAGRDAGIVEGDPNAAAAALQVGPPASRRDALVGFPLPAAPDCVVASARLRLYARSWTAGYPGRPISAARASSSWDEPGVTWSTRPGTIGAAATATVPATAGWMEWDVTAQVQAMYRYGDNGLYLRDAGPVAAGLALSFCSREETVAPCAGAQPQLVVGFSE
ncbi:MAG: large repetitive protein, partial [Thermoleophilales bacterium]|nr:large repetitive protein [Thermoleophilales bacterium]